MKKRKAAKQKAPHLPMDLWTEIHVRIPTEELVKMQFVCKSWYGLITQSWSFAQSHMDHWRSRVCPGFVVVCPSNISYLTFVSTRDGEGLRTRSLDFSIQSRNRLEDPPVVLGSCGALLLLGYPRCRELEIYNPVTGSRANLPPPPAVALLSARKGFHGDHHQEGWVIVPDTASVGCYKILAITSQDRVYFNHPRLEDPCLGTRVRCWCYCFHGFHKLPRGEESSGWKELDMHWLTQCWKMEETTHRGGKFRILFTGHKNDGWTSSRLRLVSLDITKDERFRDSDFFKQRPRGSTSGTRHMSAWNGAFYYFEQSNHEFRLWKLDNLDDKHPKWIPHLTVPSGFPSDQIDTSSKPLLIVDGTRLIVGFRGRRFYVYDRIVKKWGRVKTDKKYPYAFKFLPHIYSLLMSSAAEEAAD